MVTISLPKMASSDMAIGVLGTTGGVLASAYVGRATVSAAKLTGTSRLIGGIAVKATMGVLSFYGASKLEEKSKGATALGLFGIGCLACTAIDVVDHFFPVLTSSLRLGIKAPGMAAPISAMRPIVRAPVMAPVALPAVPVTAPIAITIKK